MNDDNGRNEPIEDDPIASEISGIIGSVVGVILLVAILGSMILDPEGGGVFGWLVEGLGGA